VPRPKTTLDSTRLKALYTDYGYAVHRRCLRVLGNPSDADDVLQEVFVRVLRYGHKFDGRNPLGWLYRIADRQCIDNIKRNRLREPVGDWQEIAEGAPAGVEGRPVDVALGCEARELIRAAKRKDAQMAIMYFVDEMTQEEVAEEMGCSRAAVRKRLARFRDLAKAERQRLADEWGTS
jgi:RNA polymerase sigma factor (sigma-70 family)